jgi:hypothetical protein
MVLMLICIDYESYLSMSFEVYVEWFCFWLNYFSKGPIDSWIVVSLLPLFQQCPIDSMLVIGLCFWFHYFSKVPFDSMSIVNLCFCSHCFKVQLIMCFCSHCFRSNWFCIYDSSILNQIECVFAFIVLGPIDCPS